MKKIKCTLFALCTTVAILSHGQSLPIAVNDTFTFYNTGQTVYLDVLANDYDTNGDSIYISLCPGYSYTHNAIIYTPPSIGFEGTVSISYKIQNTAGATSGFAKAILHINNRTYAHLDINNIKARFNNCGNNFWDLNGQAAFEVPASSGKNTMFANGLWIGGQNTLGGGLNLAGEFYRQGGSDFHGGPVANVYDSIYFSKYERVWKVTKAEINYHIANWNKPGYEPIEVIANWPGNGDESNGEAFLLAPFVDINSNGIYEPVTGDYPLIKGDQSIFYIYNDARLPNTLSESNQMGVEVHVMAYGFNVPEYEEIHNSIFAEYTIHNRSDSTYENTFIAFFNDFEIGDGSDDYIGYDVGRQLTYGYNGNAVDGSGQSGHYGNNPPAQGVMLLQDMIMPSEDISSFMALDNEYGAPHMQQPENAMQMYQFMQSYWKDGNELLYGGMGHVDYGACGPRAMFMYPGNSDPNYLSTGGVVPNCNPDDWSETALSNTPSDRRGVASLGPITFYHGSSYYLPLAFVYARDEISGNSVQALQSASDVVQNMYIHNFEGMLAARYVTKYSGYTVEFTNASSGNHHVAEWDFGDGNTANDLFSVSHTFTEPGFYEVCLTVSETSSGLSKEFCSMLVIDSVNTCTADFIYVIDTLNLEVSFSNTSVGGARNFYWQFGDASYSNTENPVHTYPQKGFYNVRLTISDTLVGCLSHKAQLITLGEDNNDCQALFNFVSDSINKTLDLTNISLGNNLNYYVWNFGDGSYATTEHASHEYETDGFYNVCLTVHSDATGCTNTQCRYIQVGYEQGTCHVEFTYVIDSTANKSASGRKVDFKGAAFGDPAKSTWDILWDFGDGNTATGTLYPTHHYQDTGFYLVHLKISSSACESDYFDLLNIGTSIMGLQGSFGYFLRTPDKSNQYPADFKGAAFGDPAVISWDFGDGMSDSTTNSPTHIYDAPGAYTVCYSISDPLLGMEHTSCKHITIYGVGYKEANKPDFYLHCYPNPYKVATQIVLQLNASSPIKISVVSLSGYEHTVYEGVKQEGTHVFSYKSSAPGMYILRCVVAEQVRYLKLVKTN